MYKNVICSAPFTALHIASNLTGVKVFPCCLYDTRQGIPFDDNKSVNEVFNQLYDIRQLFIDSHTDISNLKYCRSECIDNFPESQLKQHNNTANEFSNENFVQQPKILELHLAFSNKCNLACRTCSGQESVKLARESFNGEKEFFDQLNQATKVNIDVDSNFFKSLIQPEILKDIRRIRLTGGEPFLEKGVWKLLEALKLYSANSKKVIVNPPTNGMVKLSISQLALLEEFDMRFEVSIDGIFDHAEYIRRGLKWQFWLRNFERLLEVADKSQYNKERSRERLSITTTVSIYNIHILDQIQAFFSDNYNLDTKFNMVNYPEQMAIFNMPEKAKAQIFRQYHHRNDSQLNFVLRHLKKTRTVKPDEGYKYIMEDDRRYLMYPYKTKNFKTFESFNSNWMELLSC